MTKQTGWMKTVALLAGACASGFAAGCASEPPGNEQEVDPSIRETEQLLVPGTWVSGQGNGVVTGFPGKLGSLTVCRANYDGGQQPGKVWEGQCNFGFGGQEVRLTDYQVLLDTGWQWVIAGNTLPNNAVDGGDAGTTAHSVRLGVCQAFKSDDLSWHPGKFYANKCNIAWGHKEIAVTPDSGGNVRLLVKPT
jgi:hypothetical protein